jgi:hypothetical protein
MPALHHEGTKDTKDAADAPSSSHAVLVKILTIFFLGGGRGGHHNHVGDLSDSA